MEGIEKAAILLKSLDEPLAAEVMSLLPPQSVERVKLQIAQVDHVSREKQQQVLEEFSARISNPGPKKRGGRDRSDELLQRSLDTEGAGANPEDGSQSPNAVPFSFLQEAGPDNLLTFIVEEHPQTIALIMSHLPTQLAADVLGGLDPDKQLDVIRRIATMEKTSPEVVKDVESSLESRMQSLFRHRKDQAGGVHTVARILNVTDRMTNEAILNHLEKGDANLVNAIRRRMFAFDDLLKIDEQAMQRLLREVESRQWATALKGASEEIKDKVFSNLSHRAAESLREKMEYLGPVRISDVEGMQQQIVDAVRQLENSGEIEIAVNAGAEADEYVT